MAKDPENVCTLRDMVAVREMNAHKKQNIAYHTSAAATPLQAVTQTDTPITVTPLQAVTQTPLSL